MPETAAARETLALCGECVRALGFTVVEGDAGYMTSIRPCEGGHRGAAPAATCYATGPRLPSQEAPERPKLELVKLTPGTLDPATHCKQAIDLLAAWSTRGGELAIPDEWVVGEAVKTVALVHELVANRK